MDEHSRAAVAFNEVIAAYQERLGTQGTQHHEPMSLVQDLGAPQRFNTSSKPTVADFLADVEKAARSVLTQIEMYYFQFAYKSKLILAGEDYDLTSDPFNYEGDVVEVIENRLYNIRKAVGRELVRRKMGSVVEYLTPTVRT